VLSTKYAAAQLSIYDDVVTTASSAASYIRLWKNFEYVREWPELSVKVIGNDASRYVYYVSILHRLQLRRKRAKSCTKSSRGAEL